MCNICCFNNHFGKHSFFWVKCNRVRTIFYNMFFSNNRITRLSPYFVGIVPTRISTRAPRW